MLYRLAVEDIERGHWVAWVIDLPGCFSSARTQEEAVTLAQARISEHMNWLRNHGSRGSRLSRDEVRVEVEQVHKSYVSEGMYVVNAFFDEDRNPLTTEDVEEALWLLEATRQDLIDVIEFMPDNKLDKAIPGEMQGSIAGILEHIAWSEWWYLDRLNLAFAREEMPADLFEMLKKSRAHSRELLPRLVGDERIVERSGEKWSPRKVLRRTLWHERDHTRHIEKLMTYI